MRRAPPRRDAPAGSPRRRIPARSRLGRVHLLARVCAHEQHRNRRRSHDLLGVASHHEPPDSAPAVRADDDDVRALLLRLPDDRRRGRASQRFEEHRAALHACLFRRATYILEGLPGTLLRPDATGLRLAYALVANVLIGTLLPLCLMGRLIRRGIDPSAFGFAGLRRTVLGVAAAFAVGIAFLAAQAGSVHPAVGSTRSPDVGRFPCRDPGVLGTCRVSYPRRLAAT